MKNFVIYTMVVVGAVALSFGCVILNYTKINHWIPVLVGLSAAALLWPCLRRVWLRAGVWLGVSAHVFVAGSLAFLLFLGLNAAFPQTTTVPTDGTVVKKYRKEHERRGGYRNRVVRGKYFTYHIDIMTPDSMHVDKSVSLEKYNKIKLGTKVPMEVERGLFGYEVVSFSK